MATIMMMMMIKSLVRYLWNSFEIYLDIDFDGSQGGTYLKALVEEQHPVTTLSPPYL